MTSQGAEQAVTVGALVTAGTYAYRKLIEPSVPSTASSSNKAASVLGFGAPPSVGRFVTGWAFSFFILSIIAAGSPDVGGSLAILVTVGSLLAQGGALASDVNAKTKKA